MKVPSYFYEMWYETPFSDIFEFVDWTVYQVYKNRRLPETHTSVPVCLFMGPLHRSECLHAGTPGSRYKDE